MGIEMDIAAAAIAPIGNVVAVHATIKGDDIMWDAAPTVVALPAEHVAALDSLGATLTEMAGEAVLALGIGSYGARRVPMVIAAASEDARLVAMAMLEAHGYVLAAASELPADGIEPGFGGGYYMAWFDAAQAEEAVNDVLEVAATNADAWQQAVAA